MKTFEVWMEYWDSSMHAPIETDTLEIQALSAHHALMLGLDFIMPSLPMHSGIDNIEIICQEQDDPDAEELV
jgi:hypothetical protein